MSGQNGIGNALTHHGAVRPAGNGVDRGTGATGDTCFEAMIRHHERTRRPANRGPVAVEASCQPDNATGDIIYGARAIALFIFGDGSTRARRRVFNLWAHYRDRKERAGFLKLNGAVCLSKSQWRAFHGLE